VLSNSTHAYLLNIGELLSNCEINRLATLNDWRKGMLNENEIAIARGPTGGRHCARCARSRRSVAALVRKAVRKVVLMPAVDGPIAIWDGEPKRSSLDHDSVHDEP